MGEAIGVGTQIAGYRLEELVGRGGMGVVYRAHDLALERQRGAQADLARRSPTMPTSASASCVESRLAASLDHPNVVPIYDAGEADGQLYLAMRYVEGTDLKRLLAERGRARAFARHRDLLADRAMPSTRPTRAGSYTATSSPPTSCSTSASTPIWPTSA